MTVVACAVEMWFDGCHAANDRKFSPVCLWNSRAGAGRGSSCGSSGLPGVLTMSLISTGRWGWLALNSIRALRLHLSLLFPLLLILHSRVHAGGHSLFKVRIETSIAGPVLGGASPCRSVPSATQGNRACRGQLLPLIKAMWWKILVPRKASWLVQETWTQWEVP